MKKAVIIAADITITAIKNAGPALNSLGVNTPHLPQSAHAQINVANKHSPPAIYVRPQIQLTLICAVFKRLYNFITLIVGILPWVKSTLIASFRKFFQLFV